jgi:hypothetical protein
MEAVMPQTLKLSQALKRVRGGRRPGTIVKRIQLATEEIQKYSVKPSNEKSIFGSEEAQRKEVATRQQAVKDLIMRALKIHSSLDRKNLDTEVKTSMGTFTLAELIRLKRTYLAMWREAYTACEGARTRGKMDVSGLMSGGNPITIDPMYDEQERNEQIQKLREFDAEIDELLDAINNDERHTIEVPD